MTLRSKGRPDVEGSLPYTAGAFQVFLEKKLDRIEPVEESHLVDGTVGSFFSSSVEFLEGLVDGGSSTLKPAHPCEGDGLEEVVFEGFRDGLPGFFLAGKAQDVPHGCPTHPVTKPFRSVQQVEGTLDGCLGFSGAPRAVHSPLGRPKGVHLSEQSGDGFFGHGFFGYGCEKRQACRASAGLSGDDGCEEPSPHMYTGTRAFATELVDILETSLFLPTFLTPDVDSSKPTDGLIFDASGRQPGGVLIEGAEGLAPKGDDMVAMTVPRTLDELALHWRAFVIRELRRTGRQKFNAEDVLAHVMMKLVESDIVNKFHAGSGERSHPLTVTASEAAGMLGISLGDFLSFQVESDDFLPAVDVKGRPREDGLGYTSPKALFLFADVIALSASMTFPNQGKQEIPGPKEATVAQWRTYLSRAVANHSANFTRSHYRHNRLEHAPDYFGNTFRDKETGMVDFEDRLVDTTTTEVIDQTINVVTLFQEAPGLLKKRSEDNKSFMELLADGYTIREASKAVGLSKQDQQVLTAHLGG